MAENEWKYRVIQSRRKSIALQITEEGLVVRAPYGTGSAEIRKVVEKHREWIRRHLEKEQERKKNEENMPKLSEAELRELAQKALKVIPERVGYYASIIGVNYGRITIRNQRTRWGSCSSKGNLNFNCLLMLTPPEVIDSVVVHELCHRKEMNHSKRFYAEVLKAFPEYRKWQMWLKRNGPLLLARLP